MKPFYAGGRAYVRGEAVISHLDALQDHETEAGPDAQAELQAFIAAVRSNDRSAVSEHLTRLHDVHGIALTLEADLPLGPRE